MSTNLLVFAVLVGSTLLGLLLGRVLGRWGRKDGR